MSFFKELLSDPVEESKEKPVNTRKSEHLKEGVSPIIACIGTPQQFKQNPGAEQEILEEDPPSGSKNNHNKKNVNYYGEPDDLRRQNFKNAGYNSYAVSPIDSEDKFSKSFRNCTGVVATGIDKKTGKNISFLSHQDPDFFLRSGDMRDTFIQDLRERLEDLADQSEEGTVDAVIVGGNYFDDRPSYRHDYLSSIKLISEEVRDMLGFEPVVITGPKTVSGQDDVFYDNDNRRLYIMRPEVGNESTESYLPSEIKDQEERW